MKTGNLIASARKELNLTQKELAQRLNVSDRTVSKWERGAGFPDIGILEPLAEALGLGVLDLLRGERSAGEQAAGEPAAETLSAVCQVRRWRRIEIWKTLGKTGALLLALWCLLGCFGLIRVPVEKAVTAGVYRDGVQEALTTVHWKGAIVYQLPWRWEYRGSLQVPLDQISMDPERGMRVTIPFTEDGTSSITHQGWLGNVRKEEGPFIRGQTFCLEPSLEEFAFRLSDGTIVASSPRLYERCRDALESDFYSYER